MPAINDYRLAIALRELCDRPTVPGSDWVSHALDEIHGHPHDGILPQAPHVQDALRDALQALQTARGATGWLDAAARLLSKYREGILRRRTQPASTTARPVAHTL